MSDFPADVEGLVERLTAMAAEFQKVRPQIGSDGPTEALLREAAARLTALARQVEEMRAAASRLCTAADEYGVKFLDSDDMTDEAEELSGATQAMRALL